MENPNLSGISRINGQSLDHPSISKKETVKKVAGKGAIVAIAGGISNLSWFTAIAANRALESTGSGTFWPAVGFGIGSTVVEYTTATFATSGEMDVSWNPKSKLGKITKKVTSKMPLAVTAWRGAASGSVLDQISGRELTPQRKLAHAALYGSIMAGWVSKPGTAAFKMMGDGAEEALNQPFITAAILAGIAGGVFIASKSIDIEPAAPLPDSVVETNQSDTSL